MKKIIVVIIAVCIILGLMDSCGEKKVTCTFCKGSGVCKTCDGEGKTYRTGKERKCSICKGTGECSWCDGKGKVSEEQAQKNQETAIEIQKELNGILNKGSTSYSGTTCNVCHGTGLSKSKCTNCNGTGIDPVYESTKDSVLHPFTQKSCAKCGGSGYSKCTACWGRGTN